MFGRFTATSIALSYRKCTIMIKCTRTFARAALVDVLVGGAVDEKRKGWPGLRSLD